MAVKVSVLSEFCKKHENNWNVDSQLKEFENYIARQEKIKEDRFSGVVHTLNEMSSNNLKQV